MNIMLDIETMSTAPNAAIIAIGAVAFDQHGIVGKHYNVVNLEDAMKCGLVVDASTVMWWMNQSEQARRCITDHVSIALDVALEDFSRFLRGMEGKELWGNGSDFDNVILASAYKAVGRPLPWKHYNNRCYRTVKNLYPDVKLERVGVYHNAVDDAESQALHLIKIVDRYGIQL